MTAECFRNIVCICRQHPAGKWVCMWWDKDHRLWSE